MVITVDTIGPFDAGAISAPVPSNVTDDVALGLTRQQDVEAGTPPRRPLS